MNNQLTQIFNLVTEINESTEYAAFFHYSGHVNWIEVYVTETKEHFTSDHYVIHHTLDVSNTTLSEIDALITALSGLLRVTANV